MSMKPLNIFDLINRNVVTVGEDLHTLMTRVNELYDKVAQLEQVFIVPEQPNAHGEEGAEVVNSEPK